MPGSSGASATSSTPAVEAAAAGAQALEKAAAQAKTGTQAISAQPAGLSGKLVFQDGRNNIYVYNLETGDVYWLTNGLDPDVTRDGQRVTFMRGGGDVNGIWTINIDGSNERRIQGGGEIMRGPKWSPDGNWIVFSRNFDTDKCYDLGPFIGCLSFTQLQTQFPPIPPSVLYDIFLKEADLIDSPNWILTRVNPEGGEFRDLPVLDSAVAPDWNEDGIAYQAKPGIEMTQDKPDGQTRAVYHDGWDWDPDWQPNGGRIVYQSKEGSHWEIWSINPDGSELVALTRPGDDAGRPAAEQRGPRLQPRWPAHRLPEQPPGRRRCRPVAAVGDGRRTAATSARCRSTSNLTTVSQPPRSAAGDSSRAMGSRLRIAHFSRLKFVCAWRSSPILDSITVQLQPSREEIWYGGKHHRDWSTTGWPTTAPIDEPRTTRQSRTILSLAASRATWPWASPCWAPAPGAYVLGLTHTFFAQSIAIDLHSSGACFCSTTTCC